MEHNSLFYSTGTLVHNGSSIGISGITSTGTGDTTTTADISLNGNLILNNNTSTMHQQARVAVFQVTRNEENKITSSTFINEFWIEKKAGKSIDFAVAKLIDKKYQADEIIIKEIYTVTL